MSPIITDPQELDQMRAACQAAASILDYLEPHVRAGVTTGELERLCMDLPDEHAAREVGDRGLRAPGLPRPFPPPSASPSTTSSATALPGDKVLKNGDILNMDITIIKDGWFGDTSRMYCVGEPSILARRLIDTTYECMWLGIEQVRPGATLGDIGHAIQKHAEGAGFSVVREYCGHGVGRRFHQDPQVLHYGKPGTGLRLEPGMIFTIEPMVNAGRREIRTLADQWTVVTRDHSLSAQWEHSILVTDDGYEVLTVSPGMPAPPVFR